MPSTPTMNAAEAVLRPALAAGNARKPALKWRDTTLSYEELYDRVLRAAAVVQGHGVEPEQRVALMLKDYPGLVIAYLGAMAAGAVPIAINLRATGGDLA